jgi:hypothetical protein
MGYNDAFTTTSYLEMIQEFKNNGYILSKFNGNLSNKISLVIRHDIDVDVTAALRMAELEQENGIISTYFISMRSPFYNPFSLPNVSKINQIHQLGHDIATHINVKLTVGNPLDDIRILQSNFPFLNTQIATVHHPGSMEAIKKMIDIPVINSTYAQLFDDTVGYISDSTGRWRYGHPLDTESLRARKSLIMLTHPIWWIENGVTPREKITNLLKKERFDISDIENFLPTFFKDNY